MTKPDKIDSILQLIMDICIFVIIKTLSFDLGKFFGVAFDTLFLASLLKNGCRIDKKIGRWGLFEKTLKIEFFAPKNYF